jgi:hypothetical protein
MWTILESLENSGFATWMHEAPTWMKYSTVLALHTFGMAFLVGFSGMIALRVVGFAPGVPLAPLEKFFRPIMIGFWVNATTGVVLFTLYPTKFSMIPDFYLKLLFIACAMVSLRLLRKSVFDHPAGLDARPISTKSKMAAGALLTFWTLAILAGRLTAYPFFIEWRTAVAVLAVAGAMLAVRYLAALYIIPLFKQASAAGPVTTSTDY